MDKEKLKLIVKNLKQLVDVLESEVYSDVDAYKYSNYTDQMIKYINKETKLMTLDKEKIFSDALRIYSPNQ